MTPVTTLARKDVADAVRSRRYWSLVVVVFGLPTLLGLLFVSDAASVAPVALSATEKAELFLEPLVVWFTVVIPFVGTALGYRAVAGEREAGSLHLLFGMATTRRAVLAGKLLGRSVVLILSLTAGFLVVAAVMAVAYGLVALDLFALRAALVVGYGLVWLWLAIGVSAAVSTRYRALTVLFGLALSFVFLWRDIAVRLMSWVARNDPVIENLGPVGEATGPTWYVYGNRLSPNEAFEGVRVHLEAALLESGYEAAGTDPNAFGVAVLLAWAVVPILVGYWRFSRADLTDAPTGGLQRYLTEGLTELRDAVGELSASDPTPVAQGASGGGGATVTEMDVGARERGVQRRPPLGMPALSIAKKDFADAVRSKLLWSLAAFFFTIVAVQNYFNGVQTGQQVEPFVLTARTMTLAVPFVALVLGYRAVVGERESGSIKLLFGSPLTRRQFAVGKYLGRLAVMVLVLAGGMLVVGGFYLWQFDYLTVERLLSTTGLIVLYGAAWLGIALGISSFARSGTMSAGGIFGCFVFFTGLWDAFVGRTLAIVFTGSQSVEASLAYDTDPAWFVYLNRLNPAKSFEALNVYTYHLLYPLDLSTDGLWVPNAVGVALLLAWAVVPVVVGYLWFSRQDIQ